MKEEWKKHGHNTGLYLSPRNKMTPNQTHILFQWTGLTNVAHAVWSAWIISPVSSTTSGAKYCMNSAWLKINSVYMRKHVSSVYKKDTKHFTKTRDNVWRERCGRSRIRRKVGKQIREQQDIWNQNYTLGFATMLFLLGGFSVRKHEDVESFIC